MKPYVKRLKEYEKIEFYEKKVRDAAKRLKAARKIPTSIALEKKTVKELKELAAAKGVPTKYSCACLYLMVLKK